MNLLGSEFDLIANNYNINDTDPQRNYATWSDRYGTVRILHYPNVDYLSIEYALWNPLYGRYFISRYWHYSIWIAAVYVASTFLLQKWMANRKPYSLKGSLFAWNMFLAVFSALGCWRFGIEFFQAITKNGFEDSICRSYNIDSPSAFWAFLFSISKVFELIDTLFLILRKRPVIFLHWYHHSVVMILVLHGGRDVTAASRWFIFMNYAIHAVMYFYYATSSRNVRLPRIFAMLITLAQTFQMFIAIGISSYIALLKYYHYKKINEIGKRSDSEEKSFVCQQSDNNLILAFIIYASFAILFLNFMRVTYFSEREKENQKKRL